MLNSYYLNEYLYTSMEKNNFGFGNNKMHTTSRQYHRTFAHYLCYP